MIYLAGPYSHQDSAVMHDRFLKLNLYAAALMGQGHHVFSPISHGHPIAIVGDLPTDWEYWKSYCEKMMSICTSMVVLELDGWHESKGVAAELEIAKERGLPVTFISVEDY